MEKTAPLPVPEQMPDDMDDEELMDEDEEIQETKAKNPKQDKLDAIMMEIEMLQNDGRFRAELLHQMQEINRALVVIAGALVDIGGKK